MGSQGTYGEQNTYKTILTVCNVFVCFSSFFCFSNNISFTRDEMLSIRQNTPQNLLLDFDYSDILLDIVVCKAVALVKRYRTHRQGKPSGALAKLHQRGFRTPLPSIYLAKLHSLPNKMDKLLLLSQTNEDLSNSAALFSHVKTP